MADGGPTAGMAAGTALERGPATLLVEGETDITYLRLAARVAGRADLLDGLVLEAANGTSHLLERTAELLDAAAGPVVVLLDHDHEGRRVGKLLAERLHLRKGEQLLHYGLAFDEEFDWEAEDLVPPRLVERWVSEVGRDAVLRGTSRRPDGRWHHDVAQAAKGALAEWLAEEVGPGDVRRWLGLLEEVQHAVARQRHRAEQARLHR